MNLWKNIVVVAVAVAATALVTERVVSQDPTALPPCATQGGLRNASDKHGNEHDPESRRL